ncbi:hypothetical protein RJ55_10046 [Drechmeria coniospora]|nr:hypothetical protein RJ55_10046 [Drechmeria coniospora]
MTPQTPSNRRLRDVSSSSDSSANAVMTSSAGFESAVAANTDVNLQNMPDPIANDEVSPKARALQTNLDFDDLSLLDRITDDEASSESMAMAPRTNLNFADLELKRMLSIHSQVSTTSSYNHTQALGTESFRKIGLGTFGTILVQDGKSVVFKLAKSGDDNTLRNDYEQHSLIAGSFKKYIINEVRIPNCINFIPKSNTEFFRQRPSLVRAAEGTCHFPTGALISERILPLPKPIRQLLIEKYCNERIKAEATSAVGNINCLIRVYLGSMEGRGAGRFFSLQNFKMHLGMLARIQLNVDGMARRMGHAMAVMHWAAKTDARDVEFVLGSSTAKGAAVQGAIEDCSQRITELWLLDFNQVKNITMDKAGVDQAVEAAITNDPYIPKPRRKSYVERSAWNSFVKHYIKVSDVIIRDLYDESMAELPRLFIRGLINAEANKHATT